MRLAHRRQIFFPTEGAGPEGADSTAVTLAVVVTAGGALAGAEEPEPGTTRQGRLAALAPALAG